LKNINCEDFGELYKKHFDGKTLILIINLNKT